MKSLSFLIIILLLSVTTNAQIRLVKDIDDHLVNATATTRQPVIVNNQLLLIYNDGVHGEELWKSDGTSDGTMLLRDILEGSSSGSLQELTVANDILFFTALGSPQTGRELWKSDGTAAGTVMVKDFLSGSQLDGPTQLTELNGILYFIARNNDPDKPGQELWRSDGSAQGTYVVKETSVIWDGPYGLVKANGKLFFQAYSTLQGRELWVSDGTATGTRELKDILPGNTPGITSSISVLKPYDGGVFFTANDGVHGEEIWKSDGTEVGTVMLQDFFPGNNTFGVSLSDAACIANTIYYRIGEAEIWSSSGVDGITSLVTSLSNPNVFPQNFSRYGNKLLFSARDNASNGEMLWISDGTPVGTIPVKELNGTGEATIANMRETQGKVYFSAQDETTGREPWITDGTPEGTQRLFDLVTGEGSSMPGDFIFYKGELFFTAQNETFGQELFHQDGTIVKDVQVRTTSSVPWPSFGFQDQLFFYDYSGRFWKTNGTEAGTIKIHDYLNVNSIDRPNFATLNGKAFFIGGNLWTERDLFVTDGTTEGTKIFFDLPNIDFNPAPVLYNGFVYFCSAKNLYKTDGTEEGTQLVKILPANAHSLTPSGDYLYLVSNNNLWRTDGTETGTQLVVPDAIPQQLTASNGLVYFYTNGTFTQLWRSDGTEAGTKVIQSFPASSYYWSNPGMEDVNGTLFFTAGVLGEGKVLWKTDGTEEGTVVVKDLRINDQAFRPWFMKNVNGTLFFSANGYGNDELWKSDGTPDGTVLVKHWDSNHGISWLQSINNELFFRSGDVIDGEGIGKSDGTTAGTLTYYPKEPGDLITNLYTVGEKIYFTFNSFRNGIELYVLDTSPEVLCRDFSAWALKSNEKACVGYPVELTVTVETSNPALTYTWLKDGNIIPDQSQSKLTLPVAALSDQAKYEVIVSNGECSASPNAIDLKVKDVPVMIDPGIIEIETAHNIQIRLSSIPDTYTQGYRVLSKNIPTGILAAETNGAIDPNLTVGADYLYYDNYSNETENALSVDYTIVPVSTLGCMGDALTLQVKVLAEDQEDPDIITGNEDLPDSQSITLYPNPVDHEVRIGLKNPVPETAHISVYSTYGQVIYNSKLMYNEPLRTVDTRAWLPGSYFVVIRVSNKRTLSRKILKLK